MAEETQSRVPEVRFAGFDGDWKEYALGTIGYTQSGVGFPDAEQRGKIGTPFFKVSDMNNVGNEDDMIVANHYVSDEQINRRRWSPIKKVPAVIFAKVGAALMLNRKRMVRVPFLIDNNTMAYIFDESWDPEFGRSLFETVYLPRYSQIGALPSFKGSDIEEISVTIPQNKDEQTLIGQYFAKLDAMISQHQRKHAKLVALKKAMLQKMFPRDGATTPEIRFKGFSGDWERSNLQDLCDLFTDGDWIESKDQSPKGIRLLQTGNVGVNEFINKADKAKWVSEETFDRLKCCEVFAGDILISRLPEPAGRACIVPQLDYRIITAVDCTILRTSANCESSFLVQVLSGDSYFKDITILLGGGTRQRVSRSSLASLVVDLPEKEEQLQIGRYFKHLSELISSHKTQITRLRNIKAACLEKMFV